MLLTAFAPLPDTPDKVLTVVGLGGLLIFLCADSDSRREVARFGILAAGLVLLAVLLSIDPKWAIFGAIGIGVGSILWEVYKQEHTEELAERERLR